MREGKQSDWQRELAWSAGGAVITASLMTAFGPFGTFDALPLPARGVYWFAIIGLIWLQADLVTRLLHATLAGRLPRPMVSVPILSGLVVSVPATAIVVVLTDLMIPQATVGLLDLYWQVTLVLIAVGLIYGQLVPEASDQVPAVNSDGASRVGAAHGLAFCERFPPGLNGKLLCLEMEDHYLRIHTTHGNGLILCRMTDAERELAGVDGLRVHRSWWVARDAVQRVGREGSRPVLHLTNGLTVPVGKTYRKSLKIAGWLT